MSPVSSLQPPSAIEIRNLSYRYHDGTKALKDVFLEVRRHRKLALLGANGSGKTTLLTHLNGLLLPQSGSVKIFGEALEKKNLRFVRQKVGILFDNPDNQLFSTTVFDDVAFGPFNMNCSESEIQRRTEEALTAVGIRDLAGKPPHNLSLGQKKKAAIAGLLSMDLELYAMDEPFSGLDPQSVGEFLEILDALHRRGCTLIISTHNVDLAYSWADDIVIIADGRITAIGGYEILHDELLLKNSRLELPTLVQIFASTAFRPRNIDEARNFVTIPLNSYKPS